MGIFESKPKGRPYDGYTKRVKETLRLRPGNNKFTDTYTDINKITLKLTGRGAFKEQVIFRRESVGGTHRWSNGQFKEWKCTTACTVTKYVYPNTTNLTSIRHVFDNCYACGCSHEIYINISQPAILTIEYGRLPDNYYEKNPIR